MATKTLHLNGKIVCTYEAPENATEEMHLCRRLLQERGLWNPVSAEMTIFNQAVAFANTAALVYERDLATTPMKNGLSAGPFVVNSAFASELYFKTLGLLHGKKMRGHNLEKLLKDIPVEGAYAVEKSLTELAPQDRWQSNVKTMEDFRGVMHRHRNAFEDWRYLFERTSADQFNFREAIFTMEVLHTACQRHPKINPPV